MSNYKKSKSIPSKLSELAMMSVFPILLLVLYISTFTKVFHKRAELIPVETSIESQEVNSVSTAISKQMQEEKLFLWFFSGVFGYAVVYIIGKYIAEE